MKIVSIVLILCYFYVALLLFLRCVNLIEVNVHKFGNFLFKNT